MSNKDDLTTNEQFRLAIKLIERAGRGLARQAFTGSTVSGGSSAPIAVRLDHTMRLLEKLADLTDLGPDPEWFRDYFTLTGSHYVCLDEGWIPAECNTLEYTGEEPEEVYDEVNAPTPVAS